MFPLFRAGGNKFQGKPREKQLFFCGINLVPARFKDGGSFWASRRSAGKIMKHLIFSRKTYFSPCSEKQPHGRCSLFKALKGGTGARYNQHTKFAVHTAAERMLHLLLLLLHFLAVGEMCAATLKELQLIPRPGLPAQKAWKVQTRNLECFGQFFLLLFEACQSFLSENSLQFAQVK